MWFNLVHILNIERTEQILIIISSSIILWKDAIFLIFFKLIKGKSILVNVTSKYKWMKSDLGREREKKKTTTKRLEDAIVAGFEDRDRGQEARNTGGSNVKVRKQISPRGSRRD